MKKYILGLCLSVLTNFQIQATTFASECNKSNSIPTLKFQNLQDYTSNFDNSTFIGKILSKRKTINPFLAWDNRLGEKGDIDSYGTNGEYYGMHWTQGELGRLTKNDRLELKTPSWNYHFVGKNWDQWSQRNEKLKYVTNINWKHSDEWGKTKVMNITHNNFSQSFAKEVKSIANKGFHGVMLDWWHIYHPTKWKGKEVQNVMIKIAKTIRQEVGENFLIMGNVNYSKNKKVIKEINGVFLELYKKHPNPYSCAEIKKIEDLILFYNDNLKEPKIIALEPWRVTDRSIGSNYQNISVLKNVVKDRKSQINQKFNRLFTAMSAVLADTGYILYVDNGQDTNLGEHDHHYYDIWKLDLGNPTTLPKQLKKGIYIRGFENGYIVYNRLRYKVKVLFPIGYVIVPSFDAIFVDKNGNPKTLKKEQ